MANKSVAECLFPFSYGGLVGSSSSPTGVVRPVGLPNILVVASVAYDNLFLMDVVSCSSYRSAICFL